MSFEMLKKRTLVKYTGKEAKVIVPKGTKAIAPHAFENCMHITDVTIPKGCESIGEDAFSGCYNLENLVISEYIDDIDMCAFVMMSGVNIVIPYDDMDCIMPRAFGWLTEDYNKAMEGVHPHRALDGINMLVAVIDDKTRLKLCLSYEHIDVREFRNFSYTKSGFNVKKYDAGIDSYLRSVRLRAMVARLEYPYKLSDENEEKFSAYIQKNVKKAVEYAVASDDTAMLGFLVANGYINTKNSKALLPIIKSAVLPKGIEFAKEVDGLIKDEAVVLTKDAPKKQTAQ